MPDNVVANSPRRENPCTKSAHIGPDFRWEKPGALARGYRSGVDYFLCMGDEDAAIGTTFGDHAPSFIPWFLALGED